MRILKVSFDNVAGVPDVTLDLLDPQTGGAREIFVVTGPPGSGKTRLLEAIIAAKEVVGAYGMPVASEGWIGPAKDKAIVVLEFALDASEQALAELDTPQLTARVVFDKDGAQADVASSARELLMRYEHDEAAGKVEYIPANRALPPPGASHGLSAVEQRFLRLGRDADKYSFVPRFLVGIANAKSGDTGEEAAARVRFEANLAALAPDLKLVNDAGPLRCFSWRGGPAKLASELGGTAAHAVLLAASAALVRYDHSIVLLDRPEAGVEERAMGPFVRGLRSLGTDMQVLMATSSPSLCAGVEGRAVFRLEAH